MISSVHNPQVKDLGQLLEKSRRRREAGLFVLEGLRELTIALSAGYRIESLYHCPEILPNPHLSLPQLPKSVKPIPISPQVYRYLAYRDSTEGVLTVLHTRPHALEALHPGENAFYIVLESVEKPGNIGAVLRTADAAGANGVILCDPLTDVYNPNVLRASIGCVFSVPIAIADNPATFDWFRQHDIAAYAATLQAAVPYHTVDFRKPSAIVMGTEDKGLGPFWREHAAANIKIPMRGSIDSLNVSASTAILCFEAMRQRGFGLP